MNAEIIRRRIDFLKVFNKDWAPFALAENECIITINPVGGDRRFSTTINDRAFDLYIKPALQQAIEHTLDSDRGWLAGIVGNIEEALGKAPVIEKKTKYTCPECGGDDVELSCMINPNTMERIGEPSDDDEGYEIYGALAYVVKEDWLKENFPNL